MEWSDKFVIGIDELDKQHKQLVAIIGNFQNKFKHNTECKESYIENLMGKTLQFLVNYSRYHFEVEEEYMKKIEYPDWPEHKRLHRNLIEELKQVLLKLKSEETYKPIEFYYFVTRWLSDHMLDADKKIGKFYLEKIKPNEPDKLIAQKPDDIVIFFEEKFFKINALVKNELINEVDEKKKQIDYINSFYDKLVIRKKENLYVIFDSIELVKNKKYIDENEEKFIYTNLKESIEIDKMLGQIEDPQEKLSVLKYLNERELIAEDEFDNYKSEILVEID